MAILYRQTDPYGPLVRDSLTFAGLPWSALEGRTLAESRPGHALLAALAILQRGFSRAAVLGFIDAAPSAQGGLPGSAWIVYRARQTSCAGPTSGCSGWLTTPRASARSPDSGKKKTEKTPRQPPRCDPRRRG